jgi:glycerophosphoryl diester phosphodiesterase
MLGSMQVVAHRGHTGKAPENSLASVEAAVNAGIEAVEVDIRFSLDGTPWLLHDAHLERTTNARGPLAAMTDEVLREVRLADGSPLPTLEEVFRRFAEARTIPARLCLDVKVPRSLPDWLLVPGPNPGIEVWSEHPLVVRQAAERGLCTVLSSSGLFPRGIGQFLWQARATGASAVSFYPADIDESVARLCRNAGIPFQSGTPNDVPTWRRFIRYGINRIVTDKPLELRAFFERNGWAMTGGRQSLGEPPN